MTPTLAAVAAIPAAALASSTLLTASDVARQLGVAKTALYGWLARGDLAYHRVGRLIRIQPADVAAFLIRGRVEAAELDRYGRRPTR